MGAGTLKKELSDKFNTMDEEQEMVKWRIPALNLKLQIQASPFYPQLTRTFQQSLDDTPNELPEPKKSFRKKVANQNKNKNNGGQKLGPHMWTTIRQSNKLSPQQKVQKRTWNDDPTISTAPGLRLFNKWPKVGPPSKQALKVSNEVSAGRFRLGSCLFIHSIKPEARFTVNMKWRGVISTQLERRKSQKTNKTTLPLSVPLRPSAPSPLDTWWSMFNPRFSPECDCAGRSIRTAESLCTDYCNRHNKIMERRCM